MTKVTDQSRRHARHSNEPFQNSDFIRWFTIKTALGPDQAAGLQRTSVSASSNTQVFVEHLLTPRSESAISGATGEGLVSNVREAYAFICSNYQPGDEIILVGFSRGAYTARTIATLIRQLGLLTPKGIPYLTEIVDDWEHQLSIGWTTPYPNRPWQNRPSFSSAEYHAKLVENQLTRPDIPIKCVAVWDTVGSLGIPASWLTLHMHKFLARFVPQSIQALMPKPKPRELAFVDTAVLDNTEFAFHALALDEKRESFTPTIWYKPDEQVLPRILLQTWFPGAHSDIGGSYPNDDSADITLSWMVGQLDKHRLITFDREYVLGLIQATIQHHVESASVLKTAVTDAQQKSVQIAEAKDFGVLGEWGTGKIHSSFQGIFRLGGELIRTPKQYQRMTKQEGKTDQVLQNTFECMHLSVRIRCQFNGKDDNDRGLYKNGPPISGWKWASSGSTASLGGRQMSYSEALAQENVRWSKDGTVQDDSEEQCWMPEDELTEFERIVISRWTTALHHETVLDTSLAK